MKDYLNLEGLIYFFNKLTGRFATKEELNDVEEKIVQSDWSQTDETQNDYIKNKPDIDGLQSTIDSVSYLVGNKKVSEQIDAAIDGLADIAATGSFNDLIDKPEAISIEEINQICDTYVAARGGEF